MPVNRHSDEFRVRTLNRAAIETAHRGKYFPDVGETISAVVISKGSRELDLWDAYDTIDTKYYRDLIERAFEPFMYLAVYSGWQQPHATPLY
ncbi:MAG: hypothetical protein QW812_03415, partial [Thermoplasmataceae archaeon]